MCIDCYNGMSLKQQIDQIKEIENIGYDYDFSEWNTTSLTFLYIQFCNEQIKNYHYLVHRVYNIINNDKKYILNSINNNSINKSAYDLFDLIGNKIIDNQD